MIFSKYEYKIVQEPITINSIAFEAFAEVNFLTKYGNVVKTLKRGILSTDEIKKHYQQTKELVLDACFLKDFDINDILDDTSDVLRISAQNSVFVSEEDINFSGIQGVDTEVDFSSAYFLKGRLNFSSSSLGKQHNRFSNACFFSGDVDFSNCVFGTEENSFKNSVFGEGDKNFQYADFSQGESNFRGIDFGDGDVSFINADFSKASVTFKGSTFGEGKVDFHYAHFGDSNTSFEQILFGNGDVDFSKVDFEGGKVNFNRSVFGKGDVNFDGIELQNGKITFKKTHFPQSTIFFNEVECSGTSVIFDFARIGDSTFSFRSSIIKELSFKSGRLNNYCDFRVKVLQRLNLQDCVVRDILDFIPFDHPVLIKEMNIYGLRLVGKIFIDWDRNNVKNLIYNQKGNNQEAYAFQFRVLKENFGNTGEYIAEDKAYVEFKRCESLAQLNRALKQKNVVSNVFHKLLYYFKDILLDKAGLYATSPIRVLLSMFLAYVFFSLMFVVTHYLGIGGFSSSSGEGLWSVVADSFYVSIVTYWTIGYGDLSPFGFNRFLSGLEGFFGVFLMSYFTVAFVRRILR